MNTNWYMDSSELGAVSSPSLEVVLAAFNKLHAIPGRAIRDLRLSSDAEGAEGALLIVGFECNSCKYYLSVREMDEETASALVDTDQPDAESESLIGGEVISESLRHLVGKEAAISAIRHFYATGRMSPNLQWEKS